MFVLLKILLTREKNLYIRIKESKYLKNNEKYNSQMMNIIIYFIIIKLLLDLIPFIIFNIIDF